MGIVLVIGGGWAGIAAAVRAAEGGHRVILVEERPYLGGRARSFTDRTTGTEIDNGQHLLVGAYHHMLGLLTSLGTDTLVHKQPALRVVFVDADGTRSTLDASRAPGSAGVALGLLLLKGLSWTSRLRLLRFALRLRLGRITPGTLTCRELLLAEGQTPEALTRFWEPVVLATINAPLDQADGALLLAVMRLAFLGRGTDSTLITPSVGLSHLSQPLLEDPRVDVRLHTAATHLHTEHERITAVTLSDGSTVHPDQVIAAIPTPALGRLIPTLTVPTFAASPIISVYLWYDETWLEDHLVAMLGTTIQWVFRKPAKGLVALTVSAAAAIVTEDANSIVALCHAELRAAFPAMKDRVLVHSQVIKEKQATPLFAPTERDKRSTRQLHLPSNLQVAGDWTDTGLPATLEGAVQSGTMAAEMAIASLQTPSGGGRTSPLQHQ